MQLHHTLMVGCTIYRVISKHVTMYLCGILLCYYGNCNLGASPQIPVYN